MLKTNNRAWEVDAARGLAVVLMIVFHTVFNLATYCGFELDYMKGFWFWVGRSSALIFITVSGISTAFSKNLFKRGLTVLACAMIITIISIPVMGSNYIRFGILHFIAAAMFIKAAIWKISESFKLRNAIITALVPISWILGKLFSEIKTESPLFIPLGITTSDFASYDYYPIFPWFCVFAIGILIGSLFYGNRQSVIGSAGNLAFMSAPLQLIGRHSLPIYMIHQPIIIAILYIIFRFDF